MKTGRTWIVLVLMIVALSLNACNKTLDAENDNSTAVDGVSQSVTEECTEDIAIEYQNTTDDDLVTGDGIVVETTAKVSEGSLLESGSSIEDVVTKPSGGSTSAHTGDVEISLEGSTVSGGFQPDITNPVSGGLNSNGAKTTEALTKVMTITQGSTEAEAPTTAAKPAQAVPQASTVAVPDSTEVPTQVPVTVVPQPTTAAKPAYAPDYVIAEATKQLKALGYTYLPDKLDAALAAGKITQEEYNAWYPTDGAGYFDYTCWTEDMEYNIYELVEAQIFIDYFYIEYIGTDKWGGHIYRCYR